MWLCETAACCVSFPGAFVHFACVGDSFIRGVWLYSDHPLLSLTVLGLPLGHMPNNLLCRQHWL